MKKSFLSMVWRLAGCGSLILVFTQIRSAAAAADYLGADAVLHQVENSLAKPTDKTTQDPQSQLRSDLQAFSQNATNLAPAEAARAWLALVDRAIQLKKQSAQNFNSQAIQANDLLNALPPPPAWGELTKTLATQPAAKAGGQLHETGLRFLAAVLTGHQAEQNLQISNLQAQARDADPQAAFFYNNIFEQLNQVLIDQANDPAMILESLKSQIVSANSGESVQVTVPNLVSLVGAEKAEAFLRQALVANNVTLSFSQPNETSRLAQKLALQLIDQLKLPQWSLVNSLDAVDLYDALDKRFGEQTNAAPASSTISTFITGTAYQDSYTDASDKTTAQAYYMLGLISKDRAKDAVAMAKKFKSQGNEYYFDEAFKAMEQAGYTDALDNFLHELLAQDPAAPFWDEYVEYAAKAGQTDRMLALVRSSLADPGLSDNKKAALHEILFKALLAADNVDEGVKEIRLLIQSTETNPPATDSSDQDDAGQLGVMLARIGVLLKNPEWTEAGINAATNWLASTGSQNRSGDGTIESLAQILMDLNRGPEAEALLTSALIAANRQDKRSQDHDDLHARLVLAQLAVLYHKAGRDRDVLTLLQQSPDWQAADLSDLFDLSPGDDLVDMMSLHTGSSSVPVPYLAATALLATGQKETARAIVNELLNRYPALDRGYELLLELDGTNAIPQLDALFARDQFEARPLIWKGHLLRQENRLEESEKVLRQAIAIDPSDGEAGRGDRMRVYTELADTLAARGDKKDADFYREVVKAIRLSEDADQFYQAGLLKRAVAMYEEGLDHFADAYCIQSRLAIQLAALGKTAEAEEHYRRAYELMPDSFGRVESHCFGCEGAFDGARPQSIAEKVFTQLVAERPDKPQVHYLLGYLRSEQERYPEALSNFLAATRLDPDYLNAWVKANEAAAQTLVPPKERDQIIFNIIRLDPLRRHDQPAFDHVSDLAGLWNAEAAAASHQVATATNLLVLTASKIALAKKPANPDSEAMDQMGQPAQCAGFSPAAAVAQTPLIRLAGQIIFDYNLPADE